MKLRQNIGMVQFIDGQNCIKATPLLFSAKKIYFIQSRDLYLWFNLI